MKVATFVLVAALAFVSLAFAAPAAEARVPVCTSVYGAYCGFYLVCVGDERDANGNFQGCKLGVELVPCDPGACRILP